MKMMKRLLCVLLALMLLAGVALAEARNTAQVVDGETRRLDVQNVAVNKEGAMQLLVYNASGSLRADAVTLGIGGVDVAADSVKVYGGKTAWIILVDTSTVGVNTGDAKVRATLGFLVDNMGASDEVTIVGLGAGNRDFQFEDQSYFSSKENREKLYGSLKLNNGVRNLYDTMAKSLDILDGKRGDGFRTVLVVVSTGQTDDSSKIKYSDLARQIGESRSTVYTVAFTGGSKSENASLRDQYTSLGQASRGGIGIEAKFGDTSEAEDAARRIRDNEGNFFTVNVSPVAGINRALSSLEGEALDKAVGALASVSEITLSDGQGEATVGLSESQWESIRSRLQFPATGNEIESPDEKSVTDEEEEAKPEAEAEARQAGFMDQLTDFLKENGLIVALCAVALLAVILIVVLVSRGKKGGASRPVSQNVGGAAGGPPDEPVAPVPGRVTAPVGGSGVTEIDSGEDAWTVQVALSEEGSGRLYESVLNDGELTVGRRSDKAGEHAQLQIDNGDGKMSRKHMLLRYRNNRMMVVDMSQNGTWVNGQRISAPTELHQNDELLMGRTKFRIAWRFK